MSVSYRAVAWNANKKRYDAVMLACILIYLLLFYSVSRLAYRPPRELSDAIIAIRALGTCAIIMLHVVLCIGPLARLDTRFAPLLYNRRHLGVATFITSALHAVLVVAWYHGFGVMHPLVSVLVSNPHYGSFLLFPFEIFGVAALVILFFMAATSHDFWLKNLSPRAWKSLHMLVYVAYAALLLHVALGALQLEKTPVYAAALFLGALLVSGLHLAAGLREFSRDRRPAAVNADSPDRWLDAGLVDDIAPGRAKIVCDAAHAGERIAVFRHGNAISAVANLCAHQGGPLGEGRIIDGCITCPWHGYQYLPASGSSPPPFTEKIPTYRVRIEARRIFVDPRPFPPGTPVEPAVIGELHA